MTRRFPVAAVALGALIVAGCSSPADALSTHDARIVINGKATNALQPVTCSQTGTSWTIKTNDREPGFTATLQAGDEVTAQAVEIRNLGGFTGTFWNGNIGKAQAKISQGKFSVSGEAQGFMVDKPNHPATATFDITTDC